MFKRLATVLIAMLILFLCVEVHADVVKQKYKYECLVAPGAFSIEEDLIQGSFTNIIIFDDDASRPDKSPHQKNVNLYKRARDGLVSISSR